MPYVKTGRSSPGNGGARPGAGRPKGIPNKSTIQANAEKEAARERARLQITEKATPLVQKMIAKALGCHAFLRTKADGRLERVEPEMVEQLIAAGETVTKIFWRDPDVNAFKDLMSRALDLPRRQTVISGGDDNAAIQFVWVAANATENEPAEETEGEES